MKSIVLIFLLLTLGLEAEVKKEFYEGFLDDGELKSETEYKNGVKDGLYQKYYKNGYLKVKGTYKNGKLDGPYKEYSKYQNGELKSETEYKNGVKDGLYQQYFSDGVLKVKGTYENDKLNGMYEEYDFAEGKKVLVYKGSYKEGLREGQHISWNILYKRRYLNSEAQYKDGILDGIYKGYSEYGNPSLLINYSEGKAISGYRKGNPEDKLTNAEIHNMNKKYFKDLEAETKKGIEQSKETKDESESWGWQEWLMVVGAVLFWFISIPVGIGYFVYQYDPLFGVLSGILSFAIIYYLFFKGCKGKECPVCKTCSTTVLEKNFIGQQYAYQTTTGAPDKRYKDNPLTKKYQYTYQCENDECGKHFTSVEEEVE